jgi:hypothetical protein
LPLSGEQLLLQRVDCDRVVELLGVLFRGAVTPVESQRVPHPARVVFRLVDHGRLDVTFGP